MPTLIGFDTAPAFVRELVGTYRYLKYDVETAIAYLKAERAGMPRGQSTNTEDRQRWEHTCEVIACLEDVLDRMKRLETKTFPGGKSGAQHEPEICTDTQVSEHSEGPEDPEAPGTEDEHV
jgi:hypothetical protein